jgi:hypothetical protein
MVDALLEQLDAARARFHEALALVDVDLVTVPGVVNDWSVRDVVVHVAAWDEHGTEALTLAAGGQGQLFAYSTDDTDAMNERILVDGRTLSPADALRREDAAFGAFRDAIATLDPALLSHRLGNGDTVEEVIRYDGPDHYAEHTEHLRAWFTPDDADDALDDA